jgi:hypothetical protein
MVGLPERFFSAHYVTAEPARLLPLPGADINSGAALPSDKEKKKRCRPFEGGAERVTH